MNDIDTLKHSFDLLGYIIFTTGTTAKKAGIRYFLNPCPVCGRKDHFAVFPDTNSFFSFNGCVDGGSPIDYLVQVEGLSVKEAFNRLKGSDLAPACQVIKDTPDNTMSPKKSDMELDKVYRKLQEILHLSPAHREHLKSRGMSEQEIKKGGYRTLPPINKRGWECFFSAEEAKGTPGFAKTGKWKLVSPEGLLIPVINHKRLLVAFRIRLFGRHQKYIWMSSAKDPEGCTPGARVHVAEPSVMEEDQVVWITEGEIKANIAAEHLGTRVISVPGVSSWKKIMSYPFPRTAVISFDQEYRTNNGVAKYARCIADALIEKGYDVFAALWDETYKGIDDLLVAGGQYRLVKIK